MSSVKTTVKPYKLKPSGDSLTRDDLSTWQEVILSHMRQNDKWKDFLPGGQKSKWKAQDDSEVDDWTADVKAAGYLCTPKSPNPIMSSSEATEITPLI